MKKLTIKQMALLLLFLTSCAKTNNSTSNLEAQASGSVIAADKTLAQSASRRVALNSSGEASIDFLDNVVRAEFTILGTRLKLSLRDSNDEKIFIPSALLQKAKFKSSGAFVFVNLSDSVTVTSLVIDKSTKKVYLTKDSNLRLLDLNKISETTIEVDGVSRSVLKLRAQLDSNGTYVNVGLRKVGASLNAYKIY